MFAKTLKNLSASDVSSVLPSLVVLGLAAIVALLLAIRRRSPPELATQRAAASRALALATVIQGGHFAEEWATGFHVRFPALLGLEPMPLSFFITFNVAWIVAWALSVPLLVSAWRAAFFAAWFLAIAAMLNGIAHPLMAVTSGGYFPGLFSSPLIGLAGLYLWRQLRAATDSGGGAKVSF